jgi:hypothetical protein
LELREEPEPELYFASFQNPLREMSIVVRSSVEPESIAGAVRQAVAEVDKSVPVSNVETMEHVVSSICNSTSLQSFLLAFFSVIALLLSAAGIYGVTSYTVTQRTHELVFVWRSARVGDVLQMILRQGMRDWARVVLGLGAAFGLLRLMKSLLFGVSETDPLTYVGSLWC